jgi:hypothetical protein
VVISLKLDIKEMAPGEELATEKQREFIRALLREVGGSPFPEPTLQELGKWQASSIIDQLQEFKRELSGDKPLDTSRITGLSGGRPASTRQARVWLWTFAVILGLLLLGLLRT